MNILCFVLIAAALSCVAIPALAADNLSQCSSSRTFYIDYSAANDSSATPTNKATPWKRAPGMVGFAGSYSHQSGDCFVFKGGVTWPAAVFPMTISNSGTSNNRDYYGVDTAWFTGSSWARPLFDANYTVLSNGFVQGNASYIVLDNIEMWRQGIQLPNTGISTPAIGLNGSAWLIKNLYIHDWGSSQNATFGATGYSDGGIYLYGSNLVVDSTHLSGLKSYIGQGTMAWGGGIEGNAHAGKALNYEVRNSEFDHTIAACFNIDSCHDNHMHDMNGSQIQSFDNNIHSQVIEDDDNGSGRSYYNNLIHDNTAGINIYVCTGDYIYNNVMWGAGNNAYILMQGPGCPNTTSYIYNNTIDCSNGHACFATDSKGTVTSPVIVRNNVWITNDTPTSFPSSISNLTNTNNYTMSTSEAMSNGLTTARKLQPSTSDANVVGKGANLSSTCAGSYTGLCSDVEGAAWFGGSPETRPTGTTAWDLGAYVVNGARASAPAPPSGLSAVVQ